MAMKRAHCLPRSNILSIAHLKMIYTVPSPLFSLKIFGVEHRPIRTAILVAVPNLAGDEHQIYYSGGGRFGRSRDFFLFNSIFLASLSSQARLNVTVHFK